LSKVAIFGTGDNAQVAYYYFKNLSNKQVECFILDDEFIDPAKPTLFNVPILSTSAFFEFYPPTSSIKAFIPLGYRRMNRNRQEKYELFKSNGYQFANFISPHCNNYVLEIGENNFILEDNTIQPFVKIGNNNVIWSGNHIGHHSHIGDNNYITSHVVISGNCKIGNNCFFGVNSTFRDGLEIDDFSLVAAGALMVKNSNKGEILLGSPAKPREGKTSLDLDDL
jgi:sugar O-acyltransferase (sialic acid O-acetyltransferase NeuD family)